jgi:mono/diheme cytochrome c family protein
MYRLGWLVASLILLAGSPAAPAQPAANVDFTRQIRPILADNCFVCHGPDEQQRKAKLRLDTSAGARAALRGGGHAVVPGKPQASSLIERITAADPAERMPPASTNKKLSATQIEALRRWIEEGASYAEHWAFVAPRRPAVPRTARADARNAIDHFIQARLDREGIKASPEAERPTLIRRLSLDLTGLPPTPAEVDAFLADQSPDAYANLVRRLLASPHYGERMALDWLDAARFADTHGYHIDSGRDMTLWREWVIDAFNTNLPFDRFTVEQLAGDLLPGATLRQKIASGFNRNHMINFEGGAIPEEYLNNYIVDRVNTTATVWLGLTMACSQCHDHKYDPISQKEYYQFYAFFHRVPEQGLDGRKGNAAPTIKAPTRTQQAQLDKIERDLRELETRPEVAKGDIERLRKERADIEKDLPTAMVMEDMPARRDTFVLVRGDYDKRGQKVEAATPAFLPPLPRGAAVDRLALARWLVDPAQPLTSRVIVNRYWQMLFGTGLVKTAEDFGAQGELPSHPELLDWLAVEFRDSGWDVKKLVQLILESATYRQSSVVTKQHLAHDAENRLLARAPRFRLQAEFIRDQALMLSGLLNREIGGASVSPYQPAGLWQELAARTDSKNWSAQFFVQSHGKDLYRRTMYTFWKRTSPPPTLVTFDAPDRETCTVRRSRTNTPLQALVLMNDPTYVEAARKLAERMLRHAPEASDRVRFAFRLATARWPSERETSVLLEVLQRQRQRYAVDRAAAEKLLAVGEAPRDGKLPIDELAAYTIVASMIINLDETVTKN